MASSGRVRLGLDSKLGLAFRSCQQPKVERCPIKRIAVDV